MFALELYPRSSYVIVLYALQKEEGGATIETHIPPISERAHNAPKEPAHIVAPPVPRFFRDTLCLGLFNN